MRRVFSLLLCLACFGMFAAVVRADIGPSITLVSAQGGTGSVTVSGTYKGGSQAGQSITVVVQPVNQGTGYLYYKKGTNGNWGPWILTGIAAGQYNVSANMSITDSENVTTTYFTGQVTVTVN
jgi:hypothetical protein